jgi:DNA-binding transcriptional LysR family regulator
MLRVWGTGEPQVRRVMGAPMHRSTGHAMSFSETRLGYFVAVAEEGQLTRAAAKLHIAQPALSRAILTLESEVGSKLLERHARGVTLTPAGEVFLEKARAVVAAGADAVQTADLLARATKGVIEFGYLGVPPELTNPELIDAFTEAHPNIEISSKELPFPSIPTASWLAGVDVAIASRPAADPHVWVLPLGTDPRVVLAPKSHPLAKRSELTAAEVLDETFLGFAPQVDPAWAGFWSLDDHRGGPPLHPAVGRAANGQERFSLILAGRGIATVPARYAAIIVTVLPSVVAIPLRDADPTAISLVGREDRRNGPVEALLGVAKKLAEDNADVPLPASARIGT